MLLREVARRASEPPWRGGRITSIYFGGGTPSLMPPDFVRWFLGELRARWEVVDGLEITLEANPGTGDAERFREFRRAGINRLSIGAQSFNDRELRTLGRIHSAAEAQNAVHLARDAGFDNISLDLIYGIRGQSTASFADSVRRAVALGIEHLSTYALSIENGTPLAAAVGRGDEDPPDPDLAADQYAALCSVMREAGFDHYELTNFSLPGRCSRHNFAYWRRQPYLGIGSAAHSFDTQRRFCNQRRAEDYIAALEQGLDPVENCEILTPWDEFTERVYLALRTRDGLPGGFLKVAADPGAVGELLARGFLIRSHGTVRIPEERWLLLDEIVLRILPRTGGGSP